MKLFNSWRKRHFLGTDAAIALLLASIAVLLAYVTGTGIEIHKHIQPNLLMLYRATATVSGSLMGFSMTVTVLAINFWQAKWFDLIKRDDKNIHEIWATLKQTTWCLASLTSTALAIIAASGEGTPAKWTIIPYLVALTLTVARLARAVNIVHRMMDIAIEGSREETRDDRSSTLR